MSWQGMFGRLAFGLAVTAAAGACAVAGPVSGASAASAAGPTVSGAPVVGGTLTASGGSGDYDWYTCSGTQLGTEVSPGTASYSPTLSIAGSDVCAVDEFLGIESGSPSAPIGPVGGLPAGAGPTLSTTQPVAQGQTVTVARQGAWGGGTVVDAWEDCDGSGAGCAPVASRATGTSYTAARSDAGRTLEVVETATASNGAHSSATTAPTGVVTPSAPVDTSAPSVSGTPRVGDTLTAATGSWSNDPTSYAYAWYRCANSACTLIRGASGRTYTPTSADVGSSLEVLVTASVLSSAGQAYPSAPTGVVTGGAPPTPPGHRVRHRKRRRRAAPHVAATMLWTFRYAPVSTQVLQLDVETPPLGAEITERCTGRGCPFSRRSERVARSRHCRSRGRRGCGAPGVVVLGAAFAQRHLHSGTSLTITITRRGEVGRYYRFVMRARRQPAVTISCLAPGGRRPGRGCTVD